MSGQCWGISRGQPISGERGNGTDSPAGASRRDKHTQTDGQRGTLRRVRHVTNLGAQSCEGAMGPELGLPGAQRGGERRRHYIFWGEHPPRSGLCHPRHGHRALGTPLGTREASPGRCVSLEPRVPAALRWGSSGGCWAPSREAPTDGAGALGPVCPGHGQGSQGAACLRLGGKREATQWQSAGGIGG